MSELAFRLRAQQPSAENEAIEHWPLLDEAADEIESLEAQVASLKALLLDVMQEDSGKHQMGLDWHDKAAAAI